MFYGILRPLYDTPRISPLHNPFKTFQPPAPIYVFPYSRIAILLPQKFVVVTRHIR
jgi:hypothetical protein